MTWDFDSTTMVRPSKSSEAGTDSTSAGGGGGLTEAPASNQRTNNLDAVTPTESNHMVPFSEEDYNGPKGAEEEREEGRPVSLQLGIDETAMALEDGSRKSFVEGAQKRNSVVMVGDGAIEATDSVEVKVSIT